MDNVDVTSEANIAPAAEPPPPAPKDRSQNFKDVGGSDRKAHNLTLLRRIHATAWSLTDDEKGRGDVAETIIGQLEGFAPKDAVEAMLAAQAIALHNGTMECLRRAMIPEQSSETASKLRKDAANLARTMTDMLEALDKRRGKGPQVVRVERVVVQEGGQAIVGNIAPGGQGGQGA